MSKTTKCKLKYPKSKNSSGSIHWSDLIFRRLHCFMVEIILVLLYKRIEGKNLFLTQRRNAISFFTLPFQMHYTYISIPRNELNKRHRM